MSNDNKSVTRRVYDYILKYPEASPKEICEALNLDYDKYSNMVSVSKTYLRKKVFLARWSQVCDFVSKNSYSALSTATRYGFEFWVFDEEQRKLFSYKVSLQEVS